MVRFNSVMSMQLNIREMVVGDLTRLRFVVRYSNCPRIHDENVAEHSFYTSLYAHMIATALVAAGREDVDIGLCVGKALMHDVDECFSGDFIRSFKHSSGALKQQIDMACQKLMGDFTKRLSPEKDLYNVFFADWDSAKAGVEGRIVSFCDFLSVVSYIAQEVDAGNHRMNQHLLELRTFHESFRKEEYEFLGKYIMQAGDLIAEMEAAHHAKQASK